MSCSMQRDIYRTPQLEYKDFFRINAIKMHKIAFIQKVK